MTQSDQTHLNIRKYLLNDLDENEQRKVEEAYFCFGEQLVEVEMVEEELVEDYVRGLLPPKEHELFVRHLLTTPRYAQKVELARGFRTYAQQHQPDPVLPQPVIAHKRPWSRLSIGVALALVFLLVGVLGVWVWLKIAGRAERERVVSNTTPAQEPHVNSSPTASTPVDDAPHSPPVEVVLLPVRVRGGTTTTSKVAMPPGGQQVILRLSLPGTVTTTLRAVVLNDKGDEVISFEALQAQTKGGASSVLLTVPARAVPRGDYQINLLKPGRAGEGEEIATYYFRVVSL